MDSSHRAKYCYLHNLLNNFKHLRDQEKLCDVSIKCGATEFKAHRALLASVSPYFCAMFSGEFRESSFVDGICHVNICEFKPSTVEQLLEFIYSGSFASLSKFDSEFYKTLCDNSDIIGQIVELFRAFIYFQISRPLADEFQRIIKDFFTKLVSRGNYEEAICLFNQLCAVDDITLVSELDLEEVIKQNLETVVRKGYFAQIESFETVVNLFKHHDFLINKEIIALKAMLSWLARDTVNRLQHLNEILDTIKFSVIDADELDELIFSAGLLSYISEEARHAWQQVEAALLRKLDDCGEVVIEEPHEYIIVMCAKKCSCELIAHQTTYKARAYNTMTGHCQNRCFIPELHPLHFNPHDTLNFNPAKQYLVHVKDKQKSTLMCHIRNTDGIISKLSLPDDGFPSIARWSGTCACTTKSRGLSSMLSILSRQIRYIDMINKYGTFQCVKFVAASEHNSSNNLVVVYETSKNVNGKNLFDFATVLEIKPTELQFNLVAKAGDIYPLFDVDKTTEVTKPAKYALFKLNSCSDQLHGNEGLFIVRDRGISYVKINRSDKSRTLEKINFSSDIDKDAITSEVGAVLVKGNKLYLFGGKDCDGFPVNSVLSFDIKTHTLSHLQPMKYSRENCSAVIVNQELCILGGYQDKYGYTPVESYDEINNEWNLVNFIKFNVETDTCDVLAY